LLRTNTNFDTYNDSAQKAPIVMVVINGFTNTYTNGTFSGIAGTDKKLIKNVKLLGGEVDLLRFETSAFGIDFDIVDVDSVFKDDWENNKIVVGRKVTIKIGFQELVSTDFLTWAICYITDFKIINKQLYSIRARDKRHTEFKRTIFRNITITESSAAITDVAVALNVTSTAGFLTSTTAPWGRSTKTYLRIEDEICEYTNIVGNQFTIVRGQLGTTAVAHDTNVEVREMIVVEDTPIEFLIQILTGYNNTDISPLTWAASIGANVGLNFDKDDDIDLLQMMGEYFKWENDPGTVTWKYIWSIDEEKDAATFIREQILKLLPGYFVIGENGKLGVKCWDFRISDEGAVYDVIDDMISHNIEISTRDIVTHITSGQSFNAGRKQFNSIVETTATEIVTAFDRLETVNIRPETYNFPVSLHTDDELWLRYLKNSTRDSQIILNAKTFLKYWFHQAGDVLAITNTNIIDPVAFTFGWTEETVLLLGQNIFISQEDCHCELKAIHYDAFADIDSELFYDFAEESDMDDATLTLSANDTVVTEAADAWYDLPAPNPNNGTLIIRFLIEAILPAGADINLSIDLSFYAGEKDGADIHAVNHYNDKKPAWYNAAWAGTIYFEFYLYITDANHNIERIKVDWYNEDAAIAEDKLTSVKLVQITIFNSGLTISES